MPFESLGAVSYSPSIVTMAIFCIVCQLCDLLVENREFFYTPFVFSAPAGGDPVGISLCLMLVKLEWLGYRGEKNYDDKYSRAVAIAVLQSADPEEKN